MIDLNHGGGREISDPRGGPFTDRVNRFVDAALSKRKQEDDEASKRPYVGASAIGNECARAIQLDYIHAKYGNLPDGPRPFPGNVCRILDAGHVFEDQAADALRLAGFDMDVGYGDEGGTFRQHGFRDFDGEHRGHFDGIVRGGPLPLNYPFLWECKALNDKGTNKVLDEGLKEAKPVYYSQVQTNQYQTGMTEPCMFTIINKDTARWYHLLIGHDAEHAKRLHAKAGRIIRETAEGRLIPRPFKNPEDYRCRVFCERWCETCWKRLPD